MVSTCRWRATPSYLLPCLAASPEIPVSISSKISVGRSSGALPAIVLQHQPAQFTTRCHFSDRLKRLLLLANKNSIASMPCDWRCITAAFPSSGVVIDTWACVGFSYLSSNWFYFVTQWFYLLTTVVNNFTINLFPQLLYVFPVVHSGFIRIQYCTNCVSRLFFNCNNSAVVCIPWHFSAAYADRCPLSIQSFNTLRVIMNMIIDALAPVRHILQLNLYRLQNVVIIQAMLHDNRKMTARGSAMIWCWHTGCSPSSVHTTRKAVFIPSNYSTVSFRHQCFSSCSFSAASASSSNRNLL